MTSLNPVIETNIERILEDHLWAEVQLIENRISELNSEVSTLITRKHKLVRIAEAACIEEPI